MNTHTHSTHSIQHRSVGRHPDRPVVAPARVSARLTEEPSEQTVGGFFVFLRGYPAALGITLAVALLFVTAAAFLLCRSPDPDALTTPLAVAATVLASLGGGITAGKRNPARAISASLVSGLLTALLHLLLSLLCGGETGGLTWLLRGGMILVHVLGGALARPRKRPPAHGAGKHSSRR